MLSSFRRFLYTIFISMLAFTSSATFATGWGNYRGPTILDTLVNTDGAQALVAAVQVVDESTGSGIADLLDNRGEQIIVLAPSNAAFEKLLSLEPGSLDGLEIGVIKGVLPGVIGGLGLTVEDVSAILFKHVALPVKANRWTASENALLRKGSITVADESIFPVGIGASGVRINYETTFIKADIFAKNGVVHFIDTVITDPQP